MLNAQTRKYNVSFTIRKYDVRIAPNFAPVVEQYYDDKQSEVREIVDRFTSSIHRRYTIPKLVWLNDIAVGGSRPVLW